MTNAIGSASSPDEDWLYWVVQRNLFNYIFFLSIFNFRKCSLHARDMHIFYHPIPINEFPNWASCVKEQRAIKSKHYVRYYVNFWRSRSVICKQPHALRALLRIEVALLRLSRAWKGASYGFLIHISWHCIHSSWLQLKPETICRSPLTQRLWIYN